MAGEAPELLPQGGRLKQWLAELTDAQLGAYMLLAAGGVGMILLLTDWILFG
ncbi:MAG: hypothetical protein ACE5EQ_10115 [Phycisphaerae bacterium]